MKVTAGQEFVVGGWLPGNGRLAGQPRITARRVPRRPGGPLRYAGRVGSGIDESARDTARDDARRRTAATTHRSSPSPELPDPVWTEPELVVEVEFHEWTSAGALRAPRFRGIRDDKDPGAVVREPT